MRVAGGEVRPGLEQELWGWKARGSLREPGNVQVVEGELALVPEDLVSSAEQDQDSQSGTVVPMTRREQTSELCAEDRLNRARVRGGVSC